MKIRLDFKFVNVFKDRYGKPRIYFRRPGHKAILLRAAPGSPEFLAEYNAAVAQTGTREIGKNRSVAGTIDAAIGAYFASHRYTALAESTRGQRRSALERFRKVHGKDPIQLLKQEHVRAILGKLPPFAARDYLNSLRELMRFAAEIGLCSDDPTAGIKLDRPVKDKGDEGIHTWTEDEIAQYAGQHPIGSTARLALALALETAQRISDVVRMGPQHVKNGVLTITQEKTGVEVSPPVSPELARIIAATPSGHLAFLINSNGKPYAKNALSNAFRRWCNEAGLLVECSMHGLRKAWCRRAAERGLSELQIQSVTGHESSREVQRYTKAASRAKMARQAIDIMSSKNAG